jgi:hypothetical protein
MQTFHYGSNFNVPLSFINDIILFVDSCVIMCLLNPAVMLGSKWTPETLLQIVTVEIFLEILHVPKQR